MSLLDYTHLDVPRLASWLCVGGVTCGVTSVGCGNGKLEALLAPHVGEMVCVDGSESGLCKAARGVVTFVPISQKRRFVEVDNSHVMLLVFPISCIPLDLYLGVYRGPRIVVVADDTCEPRPLDAIQGFQVIHSEPVKGLGRTATIAVYDRI